MKEVSEICEFYTKNISKLIIMREKSEAFKVLSIILNNKHFDIDNDREKISIKYPPHNWLIRDMKKIILGIFGNPHTIEKDWAENLEKANYKFDSRFIEIDKQTLRIDKYGRIYVSVDDIEFRIKERLLNDTDFLDVLMEKAVLKDEKFITKFLNKIMFNNKKYLKKLALIIWRYILDNSNKKDEEEIEIESDPIPEIEPDSDDSIDQP